MKDIVFILAVSFCAVLTAMDRMKIETELLTNTQKIGAEKKHLLQQVGNLAMRLKAEQSKAHPNREELNRLRGERRTNRAHLREIYELEKNPDQPAKTGPRRSLLAELIRA